jgi:hypothetical protein
MKYYKFYRFQITTNVPLLRSSIEIFSESTKRFHSVRARLKLNLNDQQHDKLLWVKYFSSNHSP